MNCVATRRALAAPAKTSLPMHLAVRLAQAAHIRADHTVLVPDAGAGRLVGAVRAVAPRACVLAVEAQERYAARINNLYPEVAVVRGDVMRFSSVAIGKYDRVVMCSSLSEEVNVRRVQHAATMLCPGGCLVGVCVPGQSHELQAWVEERGGRWEVLPRSMLPDDQIRVPTVLISIEG